jgi:biopolymer transport protein ExbD
MRFIKPQWRPSLAKRRTRVRSVIDVSAFASIMLVLLLLFMGPALEVHHSRFPPADVPRMDHLAAKPDALRDDALIVTITRDGSVYFGNMRITNEELPETIREALREGAQNIVYIKADARAKYADVKAVVDRIRDAGVTNITFLAESSRP